MGLRGLAIVIVFVAIDVAAIWAFAKWRSSRVDHRGNEAPAMDARVLQTRSVFGPPASTVTRVRPAKAFYAHDEKLPNGYAALPLTATWSVR